MSNVGKIIEYKERIGDLRIDPLVHDLFIEIQEAFAEEVISESLNSARKKWGIIQAVSALEIFTKFKIREIIDKNDDVKIRAIPLFRDIKLDYASVIEIGNQKLSLGDIASYSTNISSLDILLKRFEYVLGEPFQSAFNVGKREFIDIEFDEEKVFRDISDLFRIRHLLIHENPNSLHIRLDQVLSLVKSAHSLVWALTIAGGRYCWPDWGKNQQTLNEEAEVEYNSLKKRIDSEIHEVISLCSGEDLELRILSSYENWLNYLSVVVEYSAERARGGSAERHFRATEGIAQCHSFLETLARMREAATFQK